MMHWLLHPGLCECVLVHGSGESVGVVCRLCALCGGASELIGVRQSGACARPAGSDGVRLVDGLVSYLAYGCIG